MRFIDLWTDLWTKHDFFKMISRNLVYIRSRWYFRRYRQKTKSCYLRTYEQTTIFLPRSVDIQGDMDNKRFFYIISKKCALSRKVAFYGGTYRQKTISFK